MQNFSFQYITLVVLIIGSILKAFGIEIEDNVIEGLVVGVVMIIMAVVTKRKENVNVLGMKKV